MSIFNIFKKKAKKIEEKAARKVRKKAPITGKPAKKAKPKAAAVKKTEEKKSLKKKAPAKKADKEIKELRQTKAKRVVKSDVAWKVLEQPHVTEKATVLTEKNQYIFRVAKRSNKINIAQAVKDVYGVDVEQVRIVNVPAKKRRLGKTEGWKKGYKKAIVKIKKGQEIEVLPR